jgi:hypothetical protein
MVGSLTVLRSGEDTRTWDTAQPDSVEEVRAKFDEIVGAGGTALAGDGTRLDKFDETQPEITVLPQYQGG